MKLSPLHKWRLRRDGGLATFGSGIVPSKLNYFVGLILKINYYIKRGGNGPNIVCCILRMKKL